MTLVDPQPTGLAEPYPTWINGRLYAPGEGVLPADDAGFLSGLGVFDGMLYEDGHRFFEARHLARLGRGARAIGIGWPLPWDPGLALDEFCAALAGRDAFVRLTATRGVPGLGPTLAIGARDIVRAPSGGVRLLLQGVARSPGELAAVKSTSRVGYALAREAALRRGAYDALLTRDDGEVLEGSICNVFALLRGRLVTPPVERGCLPGVMRGLLMEEAELAGLAVDERRLDVADLAAADEILVTNTSSGVAGVLELDGVARGTSWPGSAGPWAGRLAGAIRAREQADRAGAR